jgi:hypothetical protein
MPVALGTVFQSLFLAMAVSGQKVRDWFVRSVFKHLICCGSASKEILGSKRCYHISKFEAGSI